MTPRQIELVRSSFAIVEPIADTAAQIFYRRLFELDPTLRGLFADDLTEQRGLLMQMLAVVVRGLDRLDALAPAVEALGRRHTTYAVQPEDFETVGAALIDTLEEGLGEAFTPETRAAWSAAYAILSSVMISARSESRGGAAA